MNNNNNTLLLLLLGHCIHLYCKNRTESNVLRYVLYIYIGLNMKSPPALQVIVVIAHNMGCASLEVGAVQMGDGGVGCGSGCMWTH